MHIAFSVCVLAAVAAMLVGPTSEAAESSTSRSRVEVALNNIVALQRPQQDGLATFWDGNKYIQCRRMPEQALRCESAGTLMQPSLARILVNGLRGLARSVG